MFFNKEILNWRPNINLQEQIATNFYNRKFTLPHEYKDLSFKPLKINFLPLNVFHEIPNPVLLPLTNEEKNIINKTELVEKQTNNINQIFLSDNQKIDNGQSITKENCKKTCKNKRKNSIKCKCINK